VLIPKQGTKTFCSTTLLDMVYKPIVLVINFCASSTIQFHTGIHGFRASHGCNTAIQEAKWDMQAHQESTHPYHQVFLDLLKAFDTVDQPQLLLIMRAHEFGERSMHFFVNCWRDSYVVPRARGVFGPRVEVSLSLLCFQSCCGCHPLPRGCSLTTSCHACEKDFLCRRQLSWQSRLGYSSRSP
jgi:hypothetical protein